MNPETDMKISQRAIFLGVAIALAMPVASTAVAQQGVDTISLLSQASGLTAHEVQMVLGNRTAFAGYKAGYAFASQRLEQTVGPAIYHNLKEHGELTARQLQDLVVMANTRSRDFKVARK